jgi:4-amino-4-deoxy-L-arabinose transferase-like glycosyltransferase
VKRIVVLAVVAWPLATALLLANTGGHALHDGDEAIYAQTAREMAEGGDLVDLRWQGQTLLVRPPMAIWILAAARKLAPDERSVRWPLAAAAAAEVSGVTLLGAALLGPVAGLVAGGTLLGLDLFIGYARYLESEPFLCLFVIASLLAWELARRRPGWAIAWGALLGCALLTKQLIGALPLLAPIVDALARDVRVRRRWLLAGLAASVAVAAPWHIAALARHGSALLQALFIQNVFERSQTAMIHKTHAGFYLRELWRSESLFGLIALAAAIWALVDGVRARKRESLLIGLWALGPIALFSLSASRYDHYLLLAYPALALAAAQLLCVRNPMRPPIRHALAAAFVVALCGWHLPRDLAVFDGNDELRDLLRRTRVTSKVYTFNLHPYLARYYLDVDVTTLLESADDLSAAQSLAKAGLPVSAAFVPDLAAALRTTERPFTLLMPRARVSLIPDASAPVAESRHYLLFSY